MSENCIKEGDLARIETRLDGLDRDVLDLKRIYDSIHNLATNVAIIAKETANIKEDVKGIKEDVEEIKQGPADSMKYYKQTIAKGIILIIIAAFFAGKFFVFP